MPANGDSEPYGWLLEASETIIVYLAVVMQIFIVNLCTKQVMFVAA